MTRCFLKDAAGKIPKPLRAHVRRIVVVCLAEAAIAWAFLALAFLALAILGEPHLHAQQEKPGEYQVKAAYLYNFGRFTEWPTKTAKTGDSFIICVLGEDPFGQSLITTLAGETIKGKRVIAKRISSPEDAVSCRILFISSSERDRLKHILATVGKASVLTVSDLPQFSERGGMVEFTLESNRVRFEVNLATAERAGLTLSSELLKVAVNVRRSTEFGD